MDETFENKVYYYKKIFMVNKSSITGKSSNSYYSEFQIDDYKYIISFNSKGLTFIYDVKVIKNKRIIQKRVHKYNIQYYDKMHIFLDALKRNNKENKVDLLYKDIIVLFSIKKGFSFLIELFVEIYKKRFMWIFLEKLKEMSLDQKDNEENMDRESFLEKNKSILYTIISEDGCYNYDTVEFYGVILCY